MLEPSVPYPQDTEIIANVVTSPHHLSATMVTGRIHRMTELFGRLAPGVTLDQANAELRSVYSAMKKDHPEAYAQEAHFQIGAKLLRDQITSGARTVLLVLLAASGLVFIIACCNVANLILARTVRRESELAVRVALGASRGALRRMLLAEGLLLCGAGAALGVLSAQPMAALLARYASRFSARALDFRVDSSLLWVGAALAVIAAVILAFVPRLPASGSPSGLSGSSGTVRVTGNASRRQRIFAVTQIAASFVLLAGASALIATLIALQKAQTGLDTQHVLAVDVPAMSYGKTPQQVVDFYKEAMRRIDALPGVTKTAFGDVVPWRDAAAPALLSNSLPTDMCMLPVSRILGRSRVPSLPDSLPRWASLSLPAVISMRSMDRIRKILSLSSARLSHSACSPIRIRSIGMSIGRTRCCNSFPGPISKSRV